MDKQRIEAASELVWDQRRQALKHALARLFQERAEEEGIAISD
jgi:hypothetical protein